MLNLFPVHDIEKKFNELLRKAVLLKFIGKDNEYGEKWMMNLLKKFHIHEGDVRDQRWWGIIPIIDIFFNNFQKQQISLFFRLSSSNKYYRKHYFNFRNRIYNLVFNLHKIKILYYNIEILKIYTLIDDENDLDAEKQLRVWDENVVHQTETVYYKTDICPLIWLSIFSRSCCRAPWYECHCGEWSTDEDYCTDEENDADTQARLVQPFKMIRY